MRARRYSRPAIFRILLAAVVLAGVSYGIYVDCYLPYDCNIFERSAESSMMVADDASGLRGAELARRNLEQSSAWIERCPHDVDLYMIAAASLRELGRSDAATQMYERSLTLDRRPEIYLNLGQAQAEAGRTAEAIPNLAAAVRFDPALINEVPGALQQDVRHYLDSHKLL